MRYIISDLHLGHGNIIEYADRPFSDAGEMNNTLVDNWNSTVDDNDTVIFLGDVRHHPSTLTAEEWFDRLNGNILLVRGNHDGEVAQNSPIQVVESCTITHGRYRLYCEHHPADDPGFWQLHGHVHRHRPFIDPQRKNVNVSAEILNFVPLKMDSLVYLLDQKERYFTLEDAKNRSGLPE